MLVSIIIPCYNHAHLLDASVGSALRQEYSQKEIIVVDDGSKKPIVNIWGDKVKVIYHKRNRGLPVALNTGIRASKGERYVILAADDELSPAYLPVMTEQDKDIISCDFLAGGRHVRSTPGNLSMLMTANCHSYAALVKRSVFDQVGGFKETMNPSWEDWCYWIDCAKAGAQWYHIPLPLHKYNRNPEGRDAIAQGKDYLLRGKLEGYHQDLYGKGRGVVSFIIPCYNQEQYLGEAIESALNQLYPHVNVVVVDDGSPGNVLNVAKEVNDGSGRLMVVRQRNGHLSSARNVGITEALKKHNSQYLCMLDADDKVSYRFVENTMAAMEHSRYVYTDIKFIGDAWHDYNTDNYNCELLAKRHLHPCTFLMPTLMYKSIISKRGYGYDEDMKEGYEDWEFALAAVEVGWCGKRLPKIEFFYRYHNEGSMRTEASKISSKLAKYVRDKHPWTKDKERVYMGCKACGGKRYMTVVNSNGGTMKAVNVPGVGLADPGEALQVQYTGNTTSTITKLGAGGTVYKFSGNANGTYGPIFSAFARDAHLFNGPFVVNRIEVEKVAATEVVIEPDPSVVRLARLESELKPVATAEEEKVAMVVEKLETITYEPDDFTVVPGIGPAGASKLKKAGFSYLEDIADAAAEELALVLGISSEKAEKVIAAAEATIQELSIEE